MSLPIYAADKIKKWDQFTSKNEPISSVDLMERAASTCTKQIVARNIFNSAVIFCGVGNNGGDGLVIARLLHERAVRVKVYILEFTKNQSPDFKTNLARLPKGIEKISLTETKYAVEIKEDLIIDAIFGSGLHTEPKGWIAKIIDQINASKKRIVAVDLPSGLFCDDNRSNSLKHVIIANQTITFQTPKLSFLFPEYSKFVGDFHVADIGLSANFKENPSAIFFTRKDISLNSRNLFSHKGNNGYLLVVAGFKNYGGAAILTSKAAMRTGCGYVAAHTHSETKTALLSSLPECLFIEDIKLKIPEKTNAIAIGPGLGTDSSAMKILELILSQKKPLVIDADALNLISGSKRLMAKIPTNSILTPHPGELERLIGKFKSPEETLEKQIKFSKKYSVFVVQKGAFSKITCPDGMVIINSSGNPGMASAGMGDVLTGMIGSLLAQGYAAKEAVTCGVFLHGYAADLVLRKQGEKGMIASDLIDQIPYALNAF
jgi:hydroxyethylthiazole kinase-like uncharacterized protein yjeF